METDVKRIEKMAKALGDQNRLRMLQTIANKGCVQCMDFMETIQLSQPTISHHIKILTEAGLITTDKDGRFVNLSLNDENLAALISFLSTLRNQ
jgi:ArsR family transcriptional regulator, arsenate/arsenite/antimonite-responsive transcriptional repressor